MTAWLMTFALAGGDAAQEPVYRAPPTRLELRRDGFVASGSAGINLGSPPVGHRAAALPIVLTVDASAPLRHPQAPGAPALTDAPALDPAVVEGLRQRVEAAWMAQVATWEGPLWAIPPGGAAALAVDGVFPEDPRWFAWFNHHHQLTAVWYLAMHVGACPTETGVAACVRGPDAAFGGGSPAIVAMRAADPRVRGRRVRNREISTIERDYRLVEGPDDTAYDHPILGAGPDFAAQAEDAALEALRRLTAAWTEHRARHLR